MEKFQWSDKYNTTLKSIDRQHKELFKHIDVFGLAIYKGVNKKDLEKLLQFLEQYVEHHFSSEEDLMRFNNYKDLKKHIEQHDNFRELFADFKHDFETRGGDLYLAIRLEKEIRNWWEYHVLNIDMMYVPYIKEQE